MADWGVVTELALRQHLHVTRWQLGVIGVSDRAIGNRVAGHGWRRPFPGVLALPGEDTAVRRLAAALLAYSRPSGAHRRVRALCSDGLALPAALARAALDAGPVACGPSAAWLRGILPRPPREAWIRLPQHSPRRRPDRVWLRYGGPATRPVSYVHGLPALSVEDALLDLAGIGWAPERVRALLTDAIVTADALRLTDLERLDAHRARAGRFVGSAALAAVVADLRGGLSHSAAEARARRIAGEVLARHGLALHPRPYPIRLHGRVVAEADLAVVDLRYDLEIDGPHHLLPAQRRADQRRDRLAGQAGWTVDRVPVALVDSQPGELAATVTATVRRLRRAR